MRVWPATERDIEECVAIAASRYRELDVPATIAWARARINEPKLSFLRSENAVCCVIYESTFWAPNEADARLIFLAGRMGAGLWEAYSLMKEQVRRAKALGCSKFYMGTETEFDLSPIAKRLGFVHAGATYRMEL